MSPAVSGFASAASPAALSEVDESLLASAPASFAGGASAEASLGNSHEPALLQALPSGQSPPPSPHAFRTQ